MKRKKNGIRECVGCEIVKQIHGRGMCSLCYYHSRKHPNPKPPKDKDLTPEQKEAMFSIHGTRIYKYPKFCKECKKVYGSDYYNSRKCGGCGEQ